MATQSPIAYTAQPPNFLTGGGAMGAMMREYDWASTPLGPLETWPQSLRTSISTCLNSRFAILIWWGPELVMLYNDAYREIIGSKHPAALGLPGRKCFPEIWEIISPMLDEVMSRGEATRSDDLPLYLERHGYAEECYFTFSYSPIRDESGGVGGVFTPVEETTDKVIGARRLRTLQELASHSRTARDVKGVCENAARILDFNLRDVPFSAIYLFGQQANAAEVVAKSGIQPEGLALPQFIASMESPALSPLPENPTLILPLLPGQSPLGFLVAGISRHKQLDQAYRTFFDLVAGQIGAAVVEAQAYEEERKRADALAALDRVKTQFFSNISHEFRTPLTLMLAPLEDLIRSGSLNEYRDEVSLIYRNGLRLLKLVNTLLDFSRFEAGRARAYYEATDLAALTADVASCFRSAVEKGGLRYTVDCAPLGEAAFVDREMWEKIVLNLVSNAFKFTLSGEIAVSLRRAGAFAELRVKDTGLGIAEEELPRIFDRFHRIEGAQGRTHEGSGIGLAFVKDLVELHGGQVRVASVPGQGSTFTVLIPLGRDHLPGGNVVSRTGRPSDEGMRRGYVEEALRWLPDDSWAAAVEARDAGQTARLLVVEDNADMRDYLRRILASRYEVYTATDGEAALEQLRANAYDLVLSDVMMPRVDGFALIDRIRKDPEICTLPIILLSARAGEESGIEGLRAGADAYLVKPFSARDLLARVESQLSVSRLRLAAAKQERARREEADLERQRWHKLLKSAPAAIAFLRGPELVFELVNDTFISASGRSSAADFEGKRFRDVLAELVDQGYLALLEQVYRSGQPAFGKRRRMRLKRAGEGGVDERFFTCTYQPSRGHTGDIEGVLIHAIEVTEEVLAEERLEESQSEFQNLADSIPNLAWIADTTGARSWYNRQWYEYTGLREEESTGWGWVKVHDPELADGVLARYKQRLDAGELWEDTAKLRGRNGEYRWFLSRAIPIRNAEGRPVRWLGTSTDVSFEIEAQQRMGEAQRLESIGQLAGGIAHDFNNLLVPIVGYTSLAKEMLEPENQLQPFFLEIEKACDRAANLTRQLLAYAGKSRFVISHVDVGEVARETVALASSSIPRTTRIELETAPGTPAVEGDPLEIQQILMNLLLNAAEAIGERHGTITVRIGVTELASSPGGGLVVIGNVTPGQYVLLEVRDTGCGMDESTQRRICEPFFSTKFLGRGMGLAAVAGIIRAHSWGLTIQSAPEKGSTFRVFLAAAMEVEPPQPAVTRLAPVSGSEVSGTILVVDDEDIVRRTAKLALERHGYQVLPAESGATAIELFKRSGGAIELVLLDMSMPDMSGQETLAALRKINPQVKALVSSGYSEPQVLQMFSGQPTVGFIQKPYTPVQLAEKIKKVLKNRL